MRNERPRQCKIENQKKNFRNTEAYDFFMIFQKILVKTHPVRGFLKVVLKMCKTKNRKIILKIMKKYFLFLKNVPDIFRFFSYFSWIGRLEISSKMGIGFSEIQNWILYGFFKKVAVLKTCSTVVFFI